MIKFSGSFFSLQILPLAVFFLPLLTKFFWFTRQIRRTLNILLGGLVNLFPLTFGVTAHAATYYVAKTGNDSHQCAQAQNAKTPRQTIPAGVFCLSSGDTLIVKGGTYTNQEITNPPAGTAENYTTIKADPSGARPVIDPNGANFQRGFNCDKGAACSYIEVRGFEIATGYNSVRLFGNDAVGYPHHVRLTDNIMHDSVAAEILVSTSAAGYVGGDHVMRRNIFYRTGSSSLNTGGDFHTIYNTGNRSVVEGNTFHNLANGVGIWTPQTSIQNVIVRNNVFYDIGRSHTDSWQKGNSAFSAIHVSSPGGGHRIYNNIIFRSGDETTFTGIRINPLWNAKSTGDIRIYNNTIYDLKNAGAHAIRVGSTVGGPYLVRNNIAFQAGAGIVGGTQSSNWTAAPFFVNAGAGDFGLHDSSPVLDTGIALTEVPEDFEGHTRPLGAAYDIGAFEGHGSRANAVPAVGEECL